MIVHAGYGQDLKCRCATDTLITQYATDCKEIHLKNNSKLYYQFNCDSIWLTLENNLCKKIIIYSMTTQLYGYTYRLGYQLSREYDNSLLFRYGCPANGPCKFVLIDKNNGRKLREFGELIYDHETREFYDFVIYFSNLRTLTIDYIETKKTINVPIDSSRFNYTVPEYQFVNVKLIDDTLNLKLEYFENDTVKNENMKINVKNNAR